jgi:hypothetical protein
MDTNISHWSSEKTSWAAGCGARAGIEGFFACPAGAFVAEPGAARVVVEGRAPVVLVAAASDARGDARAFEASAAGRVVRGRFVVVVVVVAGAIDGLDVVLPGEARVAAPTVPGVLRTVVLLLSSPEVTDDRSGSASDAAADLDTSVVRLAAVPGTARVGALFRLDPTVLTRAVELLDGFDAPAIEGRALLDAAVGRRAPAVAAPAVVVGRRGAIASLLAEPALEAILRRTEDVGVEGAGNFFGSGLPACAVLGAASRSLAGVGASMTREAFQGWPAQIAAMPSRESRAGAVRMKA